MADGEHSSSGGSAPLWYAVGALVLVILMMVVIVSIKPLQFTPAQAPHCEGAVCPHEGAPAAEPAPEHHE